MVIGIGNFIGQAGLGFTPSAALQAWLDQIIADGETNPPSLSTQIAMDTLLSTPLSTGTVYSRMKTGYFFGDKFGSSLAWRRNIKNPATYRTTITGTLFSHDLGVKSDGTTGYVDQPFKTDEYAGIESDLTCVQYIAEPSGTAGAFMPHGFRTRSDVNTNFYVQPLQLAGSGQGANGNVTSTAFTSVNHQGVYIHRNDGTNSIVYKNGTKTQTALAPSAPNNSNDRLILARNNRGSTGVATITARYPYYLTLDFLFDGFNDTDASLMTTAVNTFIQDVEIGITDSEFNSLMDQLNLQSDIPANITVVSNAVSQWTDVSPSSRNATQGTAANRPAHSAGLITFDGSNDSLTLSSEIDLSTFSLYILLQKPNAAVSGIPIGSSSRLDFLQMTANIRQASIFKAAGGFIPCMYGAEEFFTVISIRMNGSSVVMTANDRTLLNLSNTLTSGTFRIGKLGSSSTGSLPFAGTIRAVCVSSQYLTDTQNSAVINKILSRYPYPAGTDVYLTALGDSITQGDIPTGVTEWLLTLASTQSRGFVNLGIGGTLLTNYLGTANNGRDRFEAQMITKPYKAKMLIFMGTNDIASNVTAADFGTQLDEIVQIILSYGYSSRDIVLIGLPRRIGDAQSVTVQAYNTQISTIATSRNCRYADIYTAFTSGGGDALMFDTVHPNQSGHDLIATTVDTAMAGA